MTVDELETELAITDNYLWLWSRIFQLARYDQNKNDHRGTTARLFLEDPGVQEWRDLLCEVLESGR